MALLIAPTISYPIVIATNSWMKFMRIKYSNPTKKWNRRQKLAFRRAFSTFSRQYPSWASSLFDQYFLTHRGLSVLDQVVQGANPSGALLSQLYTDQFYLSRSRRETTEKEATQVAETFLELFRCELSRRTDLLQPAVDKQFSAARP
jgi:hypothetical protein